MGREREMMRLVSIMGQGRERFGGNAPRGGVVDEDNGKDLGGGGGVE